jgi:hypothetical protein
VAAARPVRIETTRADATSAARLVRNPGTNETSNRRQNADASGNLIAANVRASDYSSMKSAYELAMERLNKQGAPAKLTEAQKKDLAELDSRYAAKIAEREIFLKGELGRAMEKGDFEAMQQLEKQLTSERKKFQTELEEKKDAVRNRK